MIKHTAVNLHAPMVPEPLTVKGVVGLQIDRRLPSGRSLRLQTHPGGEEIEIRSGRGELEVKIVLTDAGPVVTLGGGQLLVQSPDVSFRCQRFSVDAQSAVSLRTPGCMDLWARELHAETSQDIHMNGAYIRLNCTPNAAVPQLLSVPDAPSAPGRCCGGAYPAEPAGAAQHTTEPPT